MRNFAFSVSIWVVKMILYAIFIFFLDDCGIRLFFEKRGDFHGTADQLEAEFGVHMVD